MVGDRPSGTSPGKSVSSVVPSPLWSLHQVLGGVVGVAGDELGVGAADVVDVVLLAGRSCTSAGAPRCRCPPAPRRPATCTFFTAAFVKLLDVAAVQPRRAAAADALRRASTRCRCARRPSPGPGRSPGSGTRRGRSGTPPPGPAARVSRTRGRFLNQVEKRWRANGGSRRSLATPVDLLHQLAARASPGLPWRRWRRRRGLRAELAHQVGAAEDVRGQALAPGQIAVWRGAWRRPAASAGGSRASHSLCPGMYGQLT